MSAGTSTLSARERLVFPLDVAHRETALELVDELHEEVGVFKVGKQLFVQAGPEIVRAIQDRGGEVFLDLKFHDIPKTTALASVEAARLGVKMFTLHASGGGEMMQAASEAVDAACKAEGLSRPILLAVTVLTSLSPEDLRSVGINCSIEEHVGRLARLACHSGMDGLVASPLEIERIREECGPQPRLVTPGVRPLAADWGDQKRVRTPEEAIFSGADFLVVGRPIRDAENPRHAARAVLQEIETGLQRRGKKA